MGSIHPEYAKEQEIRGLAPRASGTRPRKAEPPASWGKLTSGVVSEGKVQEACLGSSGRLDVVSSGRGV